MYKHFKWIPTMILSVVTCGLYALYFWFKMAKQQNDMAEKLGEKRIMGFIGAFLLGYLTLGIYPIVWMYLFAKQQTVVAHEKGVSLTPVHNPVVLWLLTIVPCYSYYVLCTNHKRIANAFEA